MITRGFLTEETINKLAQEEVGKRQYYRPIYSIHKWWARRPGALFRAMILMAATNGKKNLFDTSSDNLQKSFYYQDHDLSDWVVLDPFMGGGTTLVEANRMGAKVIGSDLNPVSYWIVRESLKSLDVNKLDKYFARLEQSVGQKIKRMYTTRSGVAPFIDCDVLYTFWVRYINCKHCQTPIYLFKRYYLNEGAKRNLGISPDNPATVVCRHCHHLNQYKGGKTTTCEICETRFNPDEQAFDEGLCYCHHCNGEPFPLIDEVRSGAPLREKIVAIEYYHPSLKQRLYKSPDKEDLSLYTNLEKQLETESENLLFPQQEIPIGSSSARWRAHQFKNYSQVFSARQILAFNILMRGIKDIPEPEYRNAFITAFSNSLEYNNMMTPYNYPHRKLHHLFTYHALPLTTTPVENAVWGSDEEGAGTFVNCFKRYRSAKAYCNVPFDKYKNDIGEITTITSQKESIGAQFVDSFEKLKSTQKAAWLRASNSANLQGVPDKSVNAVITDPPYFDNIHYSELSNFFYVWLRLFDLGKEFSSNYVPMEHEAIVNVGQGKTDEDYYRLLQSVFSESHRVLKDDGLLMFTFHHSKSQAWWTLLFALRDSGFVIDDFFPITSEYKVNPHVRGKDALDVDLIIVCKKQSPSIKNGKLQLGLITEKVKTRLSQVNGTKPSKSRVQFYFVGEALRAASGMKDQLAPEALDSALKRSIEFAETWHEKYIDIHYKLPLKVANPLTLKEHGQRTYKSVKGKNKVKIATKNIRKALSKARKVKRKK